MTIYIPLYRKGHDFGFTLKFGFNALFFPSAMSVRVPTMALTRQLIGEPRAKNLSTSASRSNAVGNPTKRLMRKAPRRA
jgi:hypothetical protein